MKTMGQALDEAIECHKILYAQSEVYSATISEGESTTLGKCWRVEVQATHFSRDLVYEVPL